ncbi:MAG: hypothetical protein IJE05_01800 [Clostridia bacterium]|nr:hypothetical protein [Clostridia bacterium]
MGKNKKGNNKTCEQCIHCMYEEAGDMHCDEHDNFELVYEEFGPTEHYMWCGGQRFQKI